MRDKQGNLDSHGSQFSDDNSMKKILYVIKIS